MNRWLYVLGVACAVASAIALPYVWYQIYQHGFVYEPNAFILNAELIVFSLAALPVGYVLYDTCIRAFRGELQ